MNKSLNRIDIFAGNVVTASNKSGKKAFNAYCYFILSNVANANCDIITDRFNKMFEQFLSEQIEFDVLIEEAHALYSMLFDVTKEYMSTLSDLRGDFSMPVKNGKTVDGFVRKTVEKAGKDLIKVIPKTTDNLDIIEFVKYVTEYISSAENSGTKIYASPAYSMYSGVSAVCEYYVDKYQSGIELNRETLVECCTSLFIAMGQLGLGEEFFDRYNEVDDDQDYGPHAGNVQVWNAMDAVAFNNFVTKKHEMPHVGLAAAQVYVLDKYKEGI